MQQQGQASHGQPAGSPASGPRPSQPEASTSVNIAILDSKDFPTDVAPIQELYSEFIMADGRVLFECPGLVKTTGIDLMNCPLNLVLKLRARRRAPQQAPQQGSVVLWHVVLPLPLISKYLLNPPHEWETWIGLLPNTQNLDVHPPDTMFTQCVHLISRPEFPKLRLRFTYHNPQLQAQLQQQREQQQQEVRRRMEFTQQVGRAQFEELQKLTRSMRGDSAVPDSPQQPSLEPAGSVPGGIDSSEMFRSSPQSVDVLSLGIGVAGVAAPGDLVLADAGTGALPADRAEVVNERLREALISALRFVGDVRHMLATHPTATARPGAQLPMPVDSAEVLGSSAPGTVVEDHCRQLRQSLQFLSNAPAANGAGKEDGDAEALLEEGLRMALMGMLADCPSDGGGQVPRTLTNLSSATNSQLSSIQGRFPSLWESLREVSTLANERAALLEAQRLQDGEPRVSLESLQAGEAKKHVEKLLQQQRQAMQLGFDAEMSALRHQLDEMRRVARDREGEVRRLQDQLRQRTS